MKQRDLVWRELIDAAISRGERRWQNGDDLAFRAGVPPATAWLALRRLIEIGAVRQHHAGFTVVNPDKVLTSFCAARSIKSDALAVAPLSEGGLRHLMDSPVGSRLIIGGPGAAIELLGGVNTVSDYHEFLVYLRDQEALDTVNDVLGRADEPADSPGTRGNVTLLLADDRAARTWGSHTSFAQTYADLFATPGWQASEFRLALAEKVLTNRDWDQD